jgi:hypothetical protein
MSATTFEEFFELMKTEVCLVSYRLQSTDDSTTNLSIKCTLLSEHIPTEDEDQIKLQRSIEWNNLYLTDTDSARDEVAQLLRTNYRATDGNLYDIEYAIASDSSSAQPFTPKVQSIGESLKVYSINYGKWLNLYIDRILSVELVLEGDISDDEEPE